MTEVKSLQGVIDRYTTKHKKEQYTNHAYFCDIKNENFEGQLHLSYSAGSCPVMAV